MGDTLDHCRSSALCPARGWPIVYGDAECRHGSGSRPCRQRIVTRAERLPDVILNATGYIVAAHKIQVASKVLGRVAWIGVDKGDKVRKGKSSFVWKMTSTKPSCSRRAAGCRLWRRRLKEFETGSRPEEIDRSSADLEEAKANVENAKINLDRNQKLSAEGVVSKQALDDAKARYDREIARMNAIAEVVWNWSASAPGASRSTPFADRLSKRGVRLRSSRIS